jgi:hypothetical protein
MIKVVIDPSDLFNTHPYTCTSTSKIQKKTLTSYFLRDSSISNSAFSKLHLHTFEDMTDSKFFFDTLSNEKLS